MYIHLHLTLVLGMSLSYIKTWNFPHAKKAIFYNKEQPWFQTILLCFQSWFIYTGFGKLKLTWQMGADGSPIEKKGDTNPRNIPTSSRKISSLLLAFTNGVSLKQISNIVHNQLLIFLSSNKWNFNDIRTITRKSIIPSTVCSKKIDLCDENE